MGQGKVILKVAPANEITQESKVELPEHEEKKEEEGNHPRFLFITHFVLLISLGLGPRLEVRNLDTLLYTCGNERTKQALGRCGTRVARYWCLLCISHGNKLPRTP
jgi:hypothetical protein